MFYVDKVKLTGTSHRYHINELLTTEEKIQLDLILQKITETTDNTAIAFTDGSCLNNPGPCGAGAILFVEEETTELKQPDCKRGSILIGELIAIKIVLEYIDQPEIRRKIEQLTIFSDSQTAIGILTLHWKIENNKRITLEILDKMKRIQKNGIEIFRSLSVMFNLWQ
jgi:ribonuclease HI